MDTNRFPRRNNAQSLTVVPDQHQQPIDEVEFTPQPGEFEDGPAQFLILFNAVSEVLDGKDKIIAVGMVRGEFLQCSAILATTRRHAAVERDDHTPLKGSVSMKHQGHAGFEMGPGEEVMP